LLQDSLVMATAAEVKQSRIDSSLE